MKIPSPQIKILLPLLSLLLVSCQGTTPKSLGIRQGKLTPCPSSPNCVSSDANDNRHQIEPFHLILPFTSWAEVQEQVSLLPRTRLITWNDNYLHAECRSALFGFVDDLELQLRRDQAMIAVRSVSRLGYYDFGVNRRRLEGLRKRLQALGLIR